jgi:ElaB/YqjD/DUF883 family membrane-anchored ribosome-binding protein
VTVAAEIERGRRPPRLIGRTEGWPKDEGREREMSTETMQDRHRSAEERLAGLGRRIDGVRDNARSDRDKVNRSIDRRLDAVRAKNAEIRTELRRMAEEDEAAWSAYFAELDRELNELDAETVVMEAQRAADMAEDWDTFERAVNAELDGYDRMLEESKQRAEGAKADVRRRSREALDRARDKVRAAGDALNQGGAVVAQRWTAKRDEIRTEMDEVDALVIDAVADLEADMMIDVDGGRVRP